MKYTERYITGLRDAYRDTQLSTLEMVLFDSIIFNAMLTFVLAVVNFGLVWVFNLPSQWYLLFLLGTAWYLARPVIAITADGWLLLLETLGRWFSRSSGLFHGKIRKSRIEPQRWAVPSADKINLTKVVIDFVTDQLGRNLADFGESVRVLRSVVVEDMIHVLFLLERDDSTVHDEVRRDILNQQVFYLRCRFSSMLQMLKIEHAKHIGLVDGTPVDQDIEMAWSLEIGGNLPLLHSYTSAPRSANPTPVAGPGPDSELGQPVAQ